jgi:glycosyltransferase involved in cell wall biosynthesis
MNPRVSVIVRSYNRIAALCELLEALLLQEHASFEIVIVEQSTDFKKSDYNRLEELAADPKVKLLNFPPLGGPGARNEGVKNARGEILLFIDDDDLPGNAQWIKKHEKAYSDEKLVGFTGRHITENAESCPYIPVMRGFIRKKCMQYSSLKTPYTFAKFDEDVEDVAWLHGTNASIRRAWALKAGLWDTKVRNQDEHSFAFKLQPYLKNGYRLDFRKEPALIRRLDIAGGMGKRTFSLKREFQNQYRFVTQVILPYHPHLKKYYPIFVGWCAVKVGMKATANLFN